MENIKEEMAADKATAAQTIANAQDALKSRVAGLKEETRAVDQAYKEGTISAEQANDRRKTIALEEMTAAIETAQIIANAHITADNAIMASSTKETAEYKAALKDKQLAAEQLEKARTAAALNADQQIAASNRKTTDEMTAKWNSYTSGTVNAFVGGMRQMMQGQMTFGQFAMGIWNSLLDEAVKAIEGIVQRWLVAQIAQMLATKTTAVVTIADHAAIAASAAYAATAIVPFTGPELAPAAAALAYTGTLSFAPLVTAAGGYDNVAHDMVAQIHAQEMILPATIANPMRAMIAANGNAMSSGGSSSASGGGSGGGDTYNIAVSAIDAKSIDTFMRGSGGDAIVKGLVAKRRQNAGASAS